MKKVTWFYMNGCPYCRQAGLALEALLRENPAYASVEIEKIEENEHPDIADSYDYYCVPSTFVGGKKIYEARRGESYEDALRGVKNTLDAALAE